MNPNPTKYKRSFGIFGKMLICGAMALCVSATALYSADDSSNLKELEKQKKELEEQLAKLNSKIEAESKSKSETEKAKPADSKKKSEYDGIVETVPPTEIDWMKRSKFGSNGNVTVYVDEDGVPTELYVIGIAPISTTMIAVEAEEEAKEEAELNAKAAMAKWMEEHLTVKNVRDRKTLVVRKNGEEESETVNVKKEHAEQIASASFRGMSTFWINEKSADSKCIVVWRWSATEQKLAKMVELLTQDKDSDSLKRKASNKIEDFEGFRHQ